ncbi:MAG: Fe2+-dependent dioxygenase, partial [Leptolyngbyaceae cyanobacterium bins.59]|nr:Fe2+-dependent dioxygenase [Leptolyngbyaceae cyanobacterium bins.59]
MIFKIPQVLSPEELEFFTTTLADAEFTDGKLTAGWYAQEVKRNQQLKSDTPVSQDLRERVRTRLEQNPLFQAAVRPRMIHSILFSRYDMGMAYDRHTDNALMGSAFWRSDVSFTLFLSDPSHYGGGELVIEGAD